MRARLIFLVSLLLIPVFLPAQVEPQYSRINLTAGEGERITLPLALTVSGDRWETRLITRDVLSVLSSTPDKEKIEVVLKAIAPGLGRLEAVLIRQNRVLRRVYYFIKVERKKKTPAKKKPDSDKNAPDDAGKEVPGEKEFSVARKMFQQGFYAEAARYFRLFRKQYPKSPLVDRARVYEGQALFSAKRYSEALAALRGVTGSGRMKQMAALWRGHSYDALGQDSEAVEAFLQALVPGGDQEVTIRARTGLALHYARKGKYTLARLQFRLLFSEGQKKERTNSGYVLALYYAARMYDRTPVIRDIDRAFAYYTRFLTTSEKLLSSLKDEARNDFFQKLRKDARERLEYLKKNFIDFR